MKTDNFHGEVKLISTDTVYQGFFKVNRLTLQHTLYQGGWSDIIQREVKISGSVAGILLYDPEADCVLMVEQFRAGAFAANEPAWMTEVVAGYVENGEDVKNAIVREVLEETGCTVTEMQQIACYFPSAGACNEKLTLFCGFFSSNGSHGRICGEKSEAENIRTCLLSAQEAFRRLEAGEINNASSLIALQWLKMNHEKLVSGEKPFSKNDNK